MPTPSPDVLSGAREYDVTVAMDTPLSILPPPLNHSGGHDLKELEDEEALEMLPVLLLLGVMAVVGVGGNGLSLYVYYTRFNPSSTRTYVITMSVLDLLFCSVTLPGEILDIRFPLTYNAKWLCRLHRLISVTLTLASALILVAVALDRRRKICFPLRPQMTSRRVTLSVIGCIMAAVVIGFPFGVMNGRHSVPTHLEGVVGSACSVDDAFINTSFPLIYNAILLLIFIACVVAMSVSYAQIARKIVRHKRRSVGGANALALLMTKPDTDVNSRQSSSHYDESSGPGKKQRHGNETPCRTAEHSKIEDDVFPPEDKPESLPQTEAKASTAATKPRPLSAKDKDSVPVTTKSRKIFKSQSMKKKERELDQAVRTLAHAVSEDMLLSSQLFTERVSSPTTTRSRSASEGCALPSSRSTSASIRQPSGPGISADVPNDDKIDTVVKNALTSSVDNDSKESNDDKLDADVKNTLTSSGDKEEGEEEENKKKSSEDSRSKPVERNASVLSSGETNRKGVDRNASLTSHDKSKQRTKDDVTTPRRVTISESHSDRLQSIIHHTLARFKSRNQSTEDDVKSASSLRRRHWGKKIPSRTTWMMFVLTAIFVISYLPYLVLVCVRAVIHDFELGLEGWQLNLYTLGLKCYFISNIANPFVYSFCSARFRHQCRHLFRPRTKLSISD